jgi:hypothetical protein
VDQHGRKMSQVGVIGLAVSARLVAVHSETASILLVMLKAILQLFYPESLQL